MRTAKLVWFAPLLIGLALLGWGLHLELPPEPDLPGELQQRTLSWEDRERQWTLYVPENLSDAPALVFVYHGSGGDPGQSRMMYAYDFERLAEREGFLAVYPAGFEAHYNGCRKRGPYAANDLQVDDVGFMRALVAALADEFGADTARVFATGVSNGGQMALRLALEAPDLVAAVAPVATSLPTADNMDCAGAGEAVAFLLMNGTDDPMNPYDGGTVALYGLLGDRGEVLSSTETVQYWTGLAGHEGDPVIRTLPDTVPGDGSTVEVLEWTGNGRPPVALYRVIGGGHNAPHPSIKLPRLLGGTNRDFSAAEAIWDFFAQAAP